MGRIENKPGMEREKGVIITLVAVFMLFVVGAMAALSIDVVTLYTARSEAQLAADAAALAGARTLANSGMTSDPNALSDNLATNAEALAMAVAMQVAQQNPVGGANLTSGEINITIGGAIPTNPTVSVRVQKADLPTFFSRIWGAKQLKVAASSTAEAYNPSGTNALGVTTTPVSPICVKPWLLPNIDPSGGTTIFDPTSGAITDPALLGWPPTSTATKLSVVCPFGNCVPLPKPTAWKYYPGDPDTTFPPPTQALPSCAPALTTQYENSVAGCVPLALACNGIANIDTSNYRNRNRETAEAVNCMTHSTAGGGDQVDLAASPAPPPFQFLAGADNPIAGLSGNDVMVSDSLVTVPVYDSGNGQNPPTNPVTIVGFVQLFLNADGQPTQTFGPGRGQVYTKIINMVGCGSGASGQSILGNGASPVAVRLISQ
jgi:hypothetical protein